MRPLEVQHLHPLRRRFRLARRRFRQRQLPALRLRLQTAVLLCYRVQVTLPTIAGCQVMRREWIYRGVCERVIYSWPSCQLQEAIRIQSGPFPMIWATPGREPSVGSMGMKLMLKSGTRTPPRVGQTAHTRRWYAGPAEIVSLRSRTRRWQSSVEAEYFMPDMQPEARAQADIAAGALRLLRAMSLSEAMRTLDMWARSLSPMERRLLALRSRELMLSKLLSPTQRQWEMEHLPR